MSYDEVDLLPDAAVPYQCMAGAYEDMEMSLGDDLVGYDEPSAALGSTGAVSVRVPSVASYDETAIGYDVVEGIQAGYREQAQVHVVEGYDTPDGYDEADASGPGPTRAEEPEVTLTEAQREKLEADEARRERMRKYYSAMRQLEEEGAKGRSGDVGELIAVMEDAAGDLNDVGEFFQCMQQHTAVSMYEQSSSRFSKQLTDSSLMEGPPAVRVEVSQHQEGPSRRADEFDIVLRYSYAMCNSYSTNIAVQEIAFSASDTEDEEQRNVAAPHSDSSHNRDWNEEFQSLLAMPDSMAKFLGLRQLEHDFVHTAEIYGKIIIGESCLPDHLKTIKPIDIGGIAGGQKFICQGILFKFAVDTVGLYRGDDNAAKAAGLELNALMHYFYCNAPGMHVPLMALVDFRGFRLMAVSLLPIGSNTICYGTANAGITVHASPRFEKLMREVGTILNVKSHAVGHDRVVIHGGPGDIEGHEGRDGRLYLLDFARLAPPMPPKAPGQTLYRHFRMEFVKAYSTPLCSDSYSRMAPDPGYEHVKEIKEAYHHFEATTIPALVQTLEEEGSSALRGSSWVACVFHKAGVNLRFIGSVRSLVQDKAIRGILLEEAIARCIKAQLNRLFREKMKQIGVPSDEPFRRVVVDLVGLLLGQKAPYSERYWTTHLPTMLQEKFPGTLSEKEREEGALLRAVNLRSLTARVLSLAAVELTPEARAYLADEELCLDEFELLDTDLLKLECKTKHMNIIEYADGMSLFYQALSRRQREASKRRLLSLSKTILLKALHSSSMNSLAQYQLGNVFRVMSGLVADSCGVQPKVALLSDAIHAFRKLLAQRIDHSLAVKGTVSLAKTLWARGRIVGDGAEMLESVKEAAGLLDSCLAIQYDPRCAYIRAKILSQAAPLALTHGKDEATALAWFQEGETQLSGLLAREDTGERVGPVALLRAMGLFQRWLLLPCSVESTVGHAGDIAAALSTLGDERVRQFLALVAASHQECMWQLFAVASAAGHESTVFALIVAELEGNGKEEIAVNEKAMAACGLGQLRKGLGLLLAACPSLRSLSLSLSSFALSDLLASLPGDEGAKIGLQEVKLAPSAAAPAVADICGLLEKIPSLTALTLAPAIAEEATTDESPSLPSGAVESLTLGSGATSLLFRASEPFLRGLKALAVEGLDGEAAATGVVKLLASSCPSLASFSAKRSTALPCDLPTQLQCLPLRFLHGEASSAFGLELAAGACRSLASLEEATLSNGARFLYAAEGWSVVLSKPGHGAIRLVRASLRAPGAALAHGMRVTRASAVGGSTHITVVSDCGSLFHAVVAPVLQGMQTTLSLTDVDNRSLGSIKLQKQGLGHITTHKGSGVVCGLAFGVDCRISMQMQAKKIDVSLLIENEKAISWSGNGQAMGYNATGKTLGSKRSPLSLVAGIGMCLYQFLA